MERKEFDFFISHASEDKDTFVRALASELVKIGFKVWYDETVLKLGDSLFEEISNGIKKSSFGIVVISKSFLRKQWTKNELNGLINKEVFTSSKVILPIWLDITQEEVYSFSPILADKVSVRVTRNEIDKAIESILSTTNSEIVTKMMVLQRIEFLKNCSDEERKKYFIDLEARVKNLVHFQEAFYNWFCSDEVFKGEDDWDDFLVEKRCRELQFAYHLPYNVIYNSEFTPGCDMNLIIRLAKKWVLKKASVPEIYELIFLTDWYHELDFPYIVWGFPQNSLQNEEAYDLCFDMPFQIWRDRKFEQKHIIAAREKTMNKYYGASLPVGFPALKESRWF